MYSRTKEFDKRTERINLRLPEDAAVMLRKIAKEEKKSMTNILEGLIRKHYEANSKKKARYVRTQ